MLDTLPSDDANSPAAVAIAAACWMTAIVVMRRHPATNSIHSGHGALIQASAMAGGTALVAAWSVAIVPTSHAIQNTVLGCLLIALAAFDLRALVLPNVLTFLLAASGLVTVALTIPEQLLPHAVGAAIGFCGFLAIAFMYRKFRRRAGLGIGDAKLLGAGGAWASWDGLNTVILIGAVTALVYGVLMCLLTGRNISHERVPFGAFLCIGIWLTWVQR